MRVPRWDVGRCAGVVAAAEAHGYDADHGRSGARAKPATSDAQRAVAYQDDDHRRADAWAGSVASDNERGPT
jgi:hypothetical protein